MSDWAHDAALNVMDMEALGESLYPLIVKAIRKAKADGYREGALEWEYFGYSDIKTVIEKRAAEIEKGNA